jgi:NAD(P) transhydrogenase subunit beta
MISNGLQVILFLIAGILFILSLSGLSKQTTARQGNYFGIIGMLIAILATLLGTDGSGLPIVVSAMLLGGTVGLFLGARVEMTSMPQLVAILHSFVGLAAVLVGFGSYLSDSTATMNGAAHTIHLIEIYLGIFIGMVTFTGSLIAWGKLEGKVMSKALAYPGRHFVTLTLTIFSFVLLYFFISAEPSSGVLYLYAMSAASALLGVLLVMAIGGADMPVVVSMLNSYSGWAAAAAGFMLSNDLLIITGALVGSSGAILSQIMCKAMNRSIVSVIFGGWGADTNKNTGAAKTDVVQGQSREIDSTKAVDLFKAAKKVVIVPGYGMAVAKAQYPIFEFVRKLQALGTNVHFAIHPVAGRLPGHMNVLLAEANIPYDIVLEMDEVNPDLDETDIVFVLGANDIVNPSALDDSSSPIYGMPVIEAWRAKNVIVTKRSMAAGYAGIENPLFYKENTSMLYGDAKKTVDALNSML